jgi:hypothetical protein
MGMEFPETATEADDSCRVMSGGGSLEPTNNFACAERYARCGSKP